MLQLIEEAKDARLGNYKDTVENFKKEQQLMERIVEADSAILITTYDECQIKQLEEKRIVLDEKIAKCSSVNDRLCQQQSKNQSNLL